MQRRTASIERRSRGFTVLELLIVIGLITLLVTMVVVVSGNLLTAAKVRATRATIAKVHGLLEERRRAIDIAAQGKGFEQDLRFLTQRIYAMPGITDPVKAAIVKALPTLVIKSKMRQLFPQVPASSPADASEQLYAALTQKEVFGVVPVGDDAFGSAEKKDTDGDGLMEIVDAWGQPIRFYLWPTRLVRPGGLVDADNNGRIEVPNSSGVNELEAGIDANLVDLLIPSAAKQNLGKDPDDPVDAMLLISTVNTNGFKDAEAWPSPATSPAQLSHFLRYTHTLSTYHVPLLVSAGPDGDLGLEEPYDTAAFGHLAQPSSSSPDALYDNITNYQSPGSN